MTKPNKRYDTTPRLDLVSRDFTLGLFNCLCLTQFLMDFGQTLDFKSYDQTLWYHTTPRP